MSAGTCRVCSCTDQDCSPCIERTGGRCWWVEADLCSACEPDPIRAGTTLTLDIAAKTAAWFSLLGAMMIVLDRNGHLHMSAAIVPGPRGNGLRALERVINDAVAQIAGTPDLVLRVPARPERARCIHCMEPVALTTDVEAIKLHSVTCEKSPVVAQLAVARARINQLEQLLVEAHRVS
jgi:hypothetical protein